MTVSKDQPTLFTAAAISDGRTVPRTSSLTHDVAGGDGDVAAIAIKERSHAAIADTTTASLTADAATGSQRLRSRHQARLNGARAAPEPRRRTGCVCACSRPRVVLKCNRDCPSDK